jgi:hypothetical protein
MKQKIKQTIFSVHGILPPPFRGAGGKLVFFFAYKEKNETPTCDFSQLTRVFYKITFVK